MASWGSPGGSGAAGWRQVAAKTALEALLDGSWNDLAKKSPGARESPGGHFGVFWDGSAPEAETATTNLLVHCLFYVLCRGIGFDVRLLFACVARVRRSSQQWKITKQLWLNV